MKEIFFLLALSSSMLFSEVLEIYCRDSSNSSFLDCQMDLDGKIFDIYKGKNVFSFQEGKYEIVVKREGYKNLEAQFSFPSKLDSITFYLAPEEEKYIWEDLKGRQKIEGYVYDKEKGIPLDKALVKIGALEYYTDEKGYFEIEITPRDFEFGETLPVLDVCFFKSGYKDLCFEKVINIEGILKLLVDMEGGEGKTYVENEHHFFNLDYPEGKEEEEEGLPVEYVKLTDYLPEQFLLQVIDPPDSIRVGTNCICYTCSSVEVMSLETYVKRGLNDEWISTWNTHSLRAGSIAYRSYGSYYVYNPINPNYDICASTCCQAYDSDTNTSTNLATDKTAGILLQRNGSIFRAEYSAENNSWDDPNDGRTCTNTDLSCGNGYAGSPAYSWPCLSDSPCSGYGCYGHGRGMCQWGTQRWAASNSKLWKWIVNHYYNNLGSGSGLRTAYVTSPFSINSVTPIPSTIYPGDSFTINLNVTSFAEITHSQIMIGASLYNPSTGYISDPANDNKITLIPGSNSPSRQFATSSSIPEGTYNLIVALWLDVDENNIITGDDLSLVTYTLSNAIYVSGIVYGTCINPYIVPSFPFTHSSSNNSQQNLSSYNCNSLINTSGKETLYEITLSQEGILEATIAPSEGIDLFLTKGCSSSSCISFGDSQIIEYLQSGVYYLIVDGSSTSSYSLNLNFNPLDRSRPSDNTSLRLTKSSNQLLLSWEKPALNIYGGAENVTKTNIFRGTDPSNLKYYNFSTGNSLLLDDLSSSENYFYRLSFEDFYGNRSLPCQLETIVDNPEANFEGNWLVSSSLPDKWGENYASASGSSIDLNRAHYNPILHCPNQNYGVYVFYPASLNECTSTKFTLNHSSGSTLFYLDQTKNGGKWNFLGSFYFDKSYSGIISDGSCTSDKVSISDAIKWVPTPSQEFIMDDDEAIFSGDWIKAVSSYGYNGDYFWRSTGGTGSNYALWVPYLYERGNYDIYVWYREGTNRSTQAPYSITTATGDITIYVNQQINGSQWFYIGNFELNPSTAQIKLTDNCPSGYVVVADAVRFLKTP
ncbi:MAG: SpoIID/LytB domain-containing protein [Thermoanaerobaculia bacterium]